MLAAGELGKRLRMRSIEGRSTSAERFSNGASARFGKRRNSEAKYVAQSMGGAVAVALGVKVT